MLYVLLQWNYSVICDPKVVVSIVCRCGKECVWNRECMEDKRYGPGHQPCYDSRKLCISMAAMTAGVGTGAMCVGFV